METATRRSGPLGQTDGATMQGEDTAMTPLTRITLDPDVMGGKPCIRGMRITVGTIVGLVASGRTVPAILAAYPYLEEGHPGSSHLRRLARRRD